MRNSLPLSVVVVALVVIAVVLGAAAADSDKTETAYSTISQLTNQTRKAHYHYDYVRLFAV